ncbi:MAG: DUF6531 domain-containing protein, partial [Chromatiales bacterium]
MGCYDRICANYITRTPNFPLYILILTAPFLCLIQNQNAHAAQQAFLRSSYQSWVGFGIENLEKLELCQLQTLQPFPLPDACFPPGPYLYSTANGVFHGIIHSPSPTTWNDAGREYTESIYRAATNEFISEGHDEVYTYAKTLVDDGCPASAPYNHAIQQCGEPVFDKNAGSPVACAVGNPINQATGNKFQIENDIEATGPGSIEFTRVYNYTTTQQGYVQNKLLGYGWTGSFLQSLSVFYRGTPATEHVFLKRPDGKQIIFFKQGSQWLSEADIHSTVEPLKDGNGDRIGWKYKTQDNTTETYDRLGRLQTITDLAGNVYTLTYDISGATSYGYLKQVDSSIGAWLRFEYDLYGRVSTITDQANRQWQYRYSHDSHNGSHLEYVDNPDGTTKRYHYEDSNHIHALTGITDERGVRYATYQYQADGRAISSYHAGNVQRVDISYHPDGTRTISNSLGLSSTHTTTVQLGLSLVTGIDGPGCSTCSGSNTAYIYDKEKNNLLRKMHNGAVTKYNDYDAKGQVGCMVEGLSIADTSTGICTFDPAASPDARRRVYTYDPRFFNKVTSITEPSVNPAGHKVRTYTYDDYGNRTSETISGFVPDGKIGFVPISRTTTREYAGPLNQLSLIDGPRTDVEDFTRFRYYANDAVEGNNRARLKEIEDANGVLVRSNIQYSATGKVLSETHPNGQVITYTYYPGNDRLKSQTESDGFHDRITHWNYLATGEVETITQGYGTPDATSLTFAYDDARRLTRITDDIGNYIEYTLDTEGNITNEVTYDVGGVLQKQLSQSFDNYNQLDLKNQHTLTTDYDFTPNGTLDKITDGKGRVTDYNYDTLKRLTRVTQDLGGTDPTTANANTVYAYDAQDHLNLVTDPNGYTTQYTYDDLGNRLSQSSPDTGLTTYTYDEAGNRLSQTDARGVTVTYTYDALNRLTGILYPDPSLNVSYGYDQGANGIGRLTRLSDAQGTTEYGYDTFGQLISDSRTDGTLTTVFRYTYDDTGRLASLTYPSGHKILYDYDRLGQVSDLTLEKPDTSLQPLASNIQYLPFGPLQSLDYGNGLSLNRGFDQNYRLISQEIPGVLH